MSEIVALTHGWGWTTLIPVVSEIVSGSNKSFCLANTCQVPGCKGEQCMSALRLRMGTGRGMFKGSCRSQWTLPHAGREPTAGFYMAVSLQFVKGHLDVCAE